MQLVADNDKPVCYVINLELPYMNPVTSLCSQGSSSAGLAVSLRHTDGIRPCSMLNMLLEAMGERWGVTHKGENNIMVRSGMMMCRRFQPGNS